MSESPQGISESNQDKLRGLARPPKPAAPPGSSGIPLWYSEAGGPPNHSPDPISRPSPVQLTTTSFKNGKGTAGLVCGIIGLLPFPLIGFWLSLIAIILGWQGYRRGKRGEASNTGLALAGFIIGIVGMALHVALSLAIAFS